VGDGVGVGDGVVVRVGDAVAVAVWLGVSGGVDVCVGVGVQVAEGVTEGDSATAEGVGASPQEARDRRPRHSAAVTTASSFPLLPLADRLVKSMPTTLWELVP